MSKNERINYTITDDMLNKSNLTFEDYKKFSRYLNEGNELFFNDIETTCSWFGIEFINLNPSQIYSKFHARIFYHYLIGDVINILYYLYIIQKIRAIEGRYSDIPVWPLILEYIEGKRKGIYNNVDSFQKRLEESYYSIDNFREIENKIRAFKMNFKQKMGLTSKECDI